MQEMDRKGLEKPPRVKWAGLGRRIGAPTTPVPRWKVLSNKMDEVIAMAKSAGIIRPVEPPTPSARKLAASLWELRDLPLPASVPACLYTPSPNWIPYNSSPPGAAPLDNSSPWSQPGYVLDSPTSLKSTNHRQLKTRATKLSLQRLLTKTVVETGDVPADAPVVVDRKGHIPCSEFAMTGTDEVESGHNVTTSQELLKLFSQIRMLEERHNQALHLTTALHEELMQAHAQVRELELPDRMARREVERLQSTHEAEKLSWRVKEKEKIKAAVQSLKAELEEERKENNRLESANRKVTKELMEAKSETSRALQELENERKTRQLVQEVCTELAQGNDKAEVEEMKRQSQREREELEEDRRMLQLAEVWREERVQMKLREARLALETKSATLDVMRAELESFLASKPNGDTYDNTAFRDAQVLHDVVSAVRYDTTISTFPPTPSMSSNSSFAPTSEYMYGATIDTDSSQESRDHGHSLLYYPEYPEGIPDAD